MSVSHTTITLSNGEEVADVNVSLLTRREAHDLRLELTEDLIDNNALMSEESKTFYHAKIEQLKAFLGTD